MKESRIEETGDGGCVERMAGEGQTGGWGGGRVVDR